MLNVPHNELDPCPGQPIQKLEKPERILVLLHDHGSKYAGKVFNDKWMLDKGYKLETKKDDLDSKILDIIGDNGKLV